jgi:membrane-bound serine protease (ClpP class)
MPLVSALDFQADVDAPKLLENNALLIPVEFPLTAMSEMRLLETLERYASKAVAGDRPLVVLEFVPKKTASAEAGDTVIGRGTEFLPALGLARWLSGPKGSRIRSIAYIPRSITGHAVLVALGCEELAIAPLAEIGQAGIDESTLDETVRAAYLDIARRGSFPPAAVLSLLDPSETLYRLELADNQIEYRTSPQIDKIPASKLVLPPKQMTATNQMAYFKGTELRLWKWVAHIASDREQLARVLKLSKPLSEKPVFAGPRVMTRIHLRGILNARQVTRCIRAIEEGLNKPGTNLILVDVNSPGGNLTESIRLAQFLADIPNETAEVVSYVSGEARGDAALIPLASDVILMHPSAVLGGSGEATITPGLCMDQKGALQSLAKSAGHSDGELLGCICPKIEIFEYVSIDGQTQLNTPLWLSDDPIAPMWHQGAAKEFDGGLTFAKANALGIATDNPVSLDLVGNRFGIEKLPEETRTNATEQFVEWLGGQGWLSMLLFVVGIISLSAELSTPGVGIAGIISAVCFLLFFWIHLFQGTVEWLEILLILAGVVCLAAELFVLPGFGVFGVTGLILLATGLLLAGQTFVIPTNDYQWQRTATGIGQLGMIVMSLFVVAVLFRKQLASLPMVRWFALQPPNSDVDWIEREHASEELRALIGWRGTTISRCNPSGKASVGDRNFNVVSQGAWIDEDSEIVVVNVHDNTLIVSARVDPMEPK